MTDQDFFQRTVILIAVLMFGVYHFNMKYQAEKERTRFLEERQVICVQYCTQIKAYCKIHERLNTAYHKTLYNLMDYLGVWQRSQLTDYIELGVGGAEETDILNE